MTLAALNVDDAAVSAGAGVREGVKAGVREGVRGKGKEGEASVKELEPDSVRFLSIKGPN